MEERVGVKVSVRRGYVQLAGVGVHMHIYTQMHVYFYICS